ncbi:MAG: branched-chain amino acid ABC transporter permease [Thermodesulfobacteriota bacterium]
MKAATLNRIRSKTRMFVLIGVLIAALIFPLISSPRTMNFAIIGLFGAILTLGLNILYGYCGQINFGIAGFYAIGGYGVALLEKYLCTPFVMNLLIAVIVGGILTLLMSFFLVRLRGHSLVLGTIAFHMAIYTSVAKGFKGFTGGEDGIKLAPLMLFNGIKATDLFYYYLIVATIAACCWLNWTLRNSRLGRAMIEIAQNEVAAISFGVSIDRHLRLALVLNGVIAAVAGGIFVKWTGWVSPEYFGIMPSIIPVLSLVVGGVGNIVGAVVGGIFMHMLPIFMIRFAELSTLLYGLILCIFPLFLTRGIIGEIQYRYQSRKATRSVSPEEGK